ncbi:MULTISPECIES: sugar transferase [Leuconostoc]|uniref:Sugar transferase involved in lipopolysaccharide synthesis n=1 Tax=Leuconostoc citreum (strain KM20) TaxID=349519 RepID=B1MZL7_LEUCK|nr:MULTISPECIES: sugar transferase [Leuconostoc]ACA82969.1 Sugar transferase involved in lipopolysaccharide synthesis [Leuconostoc citreum KM20]KAF0261063.1 sugar transferase [Leuconostoc citreum]MBA5938366.1 sugar transferase [Leuconostoc citreum]MBE4725486.1 sugar transferase [Leuconostoc citreum]MBU7449933.1 sugar transferase [Leuconostoc citreum]
MKIKPKHKSYLIAKRLIDVVFALLGLIILSPIFLIVFVILKIDSPASPAFFKQERVGRYGKPFAIYKFRSMVPNAEAILKADPELYQKYVDNGYKLPKKEDPRITSLGAFLRRSSIDELPQFWNMLRGDMSLVGPRPIVTEELKEYGDQVDLFLSVRPGALGLWQASGRSLIEYPERTKIELEYVANAGFWYDIGIVFRNVIAIFKSEGAY